MGEVIKEVKRICIGGIQFNVELNHATSANREREIHIQNDSFRLAIPESEFLQMCASVLLAERQLRQIKGAEKLESLKEEK